MKPIVLFSSVLFLYLAACNRPQEEQKTNLFSPKVTEARGYVVPQDSIGAPKVVPAGKPRVVKAGKPEVVLTNTNVVPAGAPKVVVAGTPKIYTPGQDGYPLPKTVTAIDSPFVAGISPNWPVRDNYITDNFPQSSSSFIKLRGMNPSIINCIVKDKSGSIWVGDEGGAIRFSGRFTTPFTKAQGLPGIFVSSILQDKHGNIWFGTAGGAGRYDGKNLTNFTEKEGLSSKTITSMLEDNSGNLWFGTMNGSINKYDGKSFTHFTEEQGLGKEVVNSIVQDRKGTLWFGTASGLYGYDGKCFKHFTMEEGLSSNVIIRVLPDKKGNLWLGMEKSGISLYDGKTFKHFTKKEGLSDDGIWDMTMDNNGNLWCATVAGGVCRFDGKFFTHYTNKKDLTDAEANAIYHDNSGNIWVGGGIKDGLMRFNDVCFTHYTQKEGLSDYQIWSLLKDKSGKLWIGTNSGGVNRYDGKSFAHFSTKQGMSSNFVTDMTQDKKGNIWFATWDGAICYDGKSFLYLTEKEGLPSNALESVFEDKNGNIWFGTYGAGICRYDGKSFTNYTKKQGLSDNMVLCAIQDNNGVFWFGTNYGGVTRYDGQTFTHFTIKEGLSNTVSAIYQDKSNYLWFCTSGQGAIRYDGKSFMHFTDKEGLKGSSIEGMLQDKNGNFYFPGGAGLLILGHDYPAKLGEKSGNGQGNQTMLFRSFSPGDGFTGLGGYGPICEDDSGTIWIAAKDRLTAYHPDRDHPDTTAPVIQLTGIQLYNLNVPWPELFKNKDTVFVLDNGVKIKNFEFDSISQWFSYPQNLSLAYNNNYLTFTFLGITPKLSTRVTYKYKLEGLDENWNTFNSPIRADAPYGNIPPGTYTFKVKAMNNEGYWSEEFNYTFTIRPPWWKTWWAYTAYILIILGGIGAVIYSILENQRKKIRLIINERNRIARELHDDIGAELTRITILSQFLQKNTNVEEEIREKLRKISETGKKVLGNIGEIIWTMNPQKDNLDGLAAYIRRFVTEYLETNDIDLHIEFPNEIPANAISDEYRRNVFLVIKEAISNITKYSKATNVRLSMNVGEKLAEFEISDNGTGFSVKEKENWGNGLRNMNQRMKDIGGTFIIRSEIDHGTNIRLTFPVR